jgi:hypothetical protein
VFPFFSFRLVLAASHVRGDHVIITAITRNLYCTLQCAAGGHLTGQFFFFSLNYSISFRTNKRFLAFIERKKILVLRVYYWIFFISTGSLPENVEFYNIFIYDIYIYIYIYIYVGMFAQNLFFDNYYDKTFFFYQKKTLFSLSQIFLHFFFFL